MDEIKIKELALEIIKIHLSYYTMLVELLDIKKKLIKETEKNTIIHNLFTKKIIGVHESATGFLSREIKFLSEIKSTSDIRQAIFRRGRILSIYFESRTSPIEFREHTIFIGNEAVDVMLYNNYTPKINRLLNKILKLYERRGI